MNSTQNVIQIPQNSREKPGDSLDTPTENKISGMSLKIRESFTDSSLESHSTTDLDSLSSGTQFSRSVSTTITSVGEKTAIFYAERPEKHDPRIQAFHTSPQDEFLDFIHPTPILPPSYDELPPGGCPKYPITDMICENEQLPVYSAAAFKFGICMRKQEFVSPYDISNNRSWKTLAVELNSTQINFYAVSNQLEKTLRRQNLILSGEQASNIVSSDSMDRHSSLVTSFQDVKLHEICERNGVFKQEVLDHEGISGGVPTSQQVKNGKHKLIRSYSLQHAKFGLASDYTKKPNVLRLRLENEQILLQFSSTKELIDWHLAISIGKDVSLDIAYREIPKYRTVPRRRRNAIASNLISWNEIIKRQARAQSDAVSQRDKPSLGSNLIGIFTKRSASTTRSLDETSDLVIISSAARPMAERCSNITAPIEPVHSSAPRYFSISKNSDSEKASNISANIAQDQTNHALLIDSSRQDLSEFGRTSEEIHESEDEYEEYEADSDIEISDTTRLDIPTSRDNRSREVYLNDLKWDPTHKLESERRFLRNCIKCIRPLGFDDKWLNKSMVKPTTKTPPISHFQMKNSTSDVRLAGLVDVKSLNAGSSRLFSGRGKKDNSLKDVAKANTALNRIPCHYLQEFVVGSHYLIPKSL